MLYIGVDIHKLKHEIAIVNESGNLCGKSFKIKNSYEGLDLLYQRIARVNPDKEPLIFALEATGPYWLALHSHLRDDGHRVVVLNPLRSSAYRKLNIRPAKTDRIDAWCIAEVVRLGIAEENPLPSAKILGLRQLTRQRVELTSHLADQKRRIHSLLEQMFPEFEDLFHPMFGRTAMALLGAYPTPAEIAALGLEGLTAFIQEQSNNHLGETKAKEILQAAQNSFGVSFGQEAFSIQIKLLVEQITFLKQQLKTLGREIEVVFAEIPQYLTTVPGVGAVLAAAILSEIGDVHRFKNAKALVAYAGIDPRVFQSGQFTASDAHISKRGSPYLRRAIWQAAVAAARVDPALKALHKRKMAEGMSFQSAMGVVANKLIHIIYAVLRDNKPYYVDVSSLSPECSDRAAASPVAP